MKILKLLIIIIISTVNLTGCYDAAQIDEEVYPLICGIDKGVNNKLRLTVQYPNYKEGGGGGDKKSGGGGSGGGQEKTEGIREVDGTIVVTVEAPTVIEGLNIINATVPRRISLMHTKMIVFSEEYAREGTLALVSAFQRYRETRSEMLIAVCNGKAEDFIEENKSAIGTSPSKSIELMRGQASTNGYFPIVTLHKFYMNVLSEDQQPYASYVGTNDFKTMEQEQGEGILITESDISAGKLPLKGTAKREFGGTAVFNRDKMVGLLNMFETRYFTMVTGDFKRAIITLKDKAKQGTALPLDIRLGRKPKIKAYFQNGAPVIDVNLNIEADVVGIQSRYPYENVNKIEDLNKEIEEHIKKNVQDVIRKAQDMKSDIFGFGYYMSANFLTIGEWKDYNWHEKFPKAEINVSVDANVRRTGIMFESFKPLGRNED